MAQNFNPDSYKELGRTDSVIKYRFITDFAKLMSLSMKFTVIEKSIRLFDYWLLSLQDFTFFL